MRRYGKRRGGSKRVYNSNRGSRKASPSPTEMVYNNDLAEEAEDYQTDGTYRGYVTELDTLR